MNELLPRRHDPLVPEIQQAVCWAFSVGLDELVAPHGPRRVQRARQVALYLARTLTGLSTPAIGARFGDRDHTTVIHAERRIAALLTSDPGVIVGLEAACVRVARLTALRVAAPWRSPTRARRRGRVCCCSICEAAREQFPSDPPQLPLFSGDA